jgi:hypothetical protein
VTLSGRATKNGVVANLPLCVDLAEDLADGTKAGAELPLEDDDPATWRQLQTVSDFEGRDGRGLSKNEVSHLIGKGKRESETAPATGKQRARLKRAGYWEDGMKKSEATARISELKRWEWERED